jgi:hypothetical protein
MNEPRQASPGRHPSPHRHRLSLWAAWFGILGAPVAWSLQQLINPPMFAHGCFPKDAPLTESIWRNSGSVAFTVELAALLVCVLSGVVAWRNWQRTRGEKEGSGHHLIEAGDGRSRFMAMVGMICSGLFLLAVVVTAGLSYLVAGCYG